MLLRLISFIGLAAATGAALADTKCTSADGVLGYNHVNLIGGAPPPEGAKAQIFEIFYRGELVSSSSTYVGLEPTLGPISPIFTETQTLNVESLPYGEIRTFTAKLTLEKNASWMGEFPEPAIGVSDYVICRAENFARP